MAKKKKSGNQSSAKAVNKPAAAEEKDVKEETVEEEVKTDQADSADTDTEENTKPQTPEEDDFTVETFDDYKKPEEEKEEEASEEDEESEEDNEDEEKDEDDSKKKSSKESSKKEKKLDPKKEEKKAAKKNKRALKERAFKRGWFSIALVALFLAAVILINLIASTLVQKIPSLVIDTTGTDNFVLSDDTKDYISNLKDDITLTVLGEEKAFKEGGEYYMLTNSLLHDFENESDKITLKYVDMTAEPTFVSKYPDESLSQYGVIVECEKGYKYLAQIDYLETTINYQSYQYEITSSKIEEAVVSAILNITLENKPKVTFISDINDNDYSGFKTLLDNNGFETNEVSPAANKIPDDTKVLVLFTPNTDLDSKYVDMISDYLNNDGNYGREFIYVPSHKMFDLPNINSLVEEWGITVENKYALENDSNYLAPIGIGTYMYLTQYSSDASSYTQKMKNSNLPFCVVGGYTLTLTVNESEKVQKLFTLSDQAQTIKLESDDTPGKEVDEPNAVLGAVGYKSKESTDTDGSGTDTKQQSNVIVYASGVALSSDLLNSSRYGNAQFTLAMLNTMLDRDNVGVSIESKSLESESLGITSAQINGLSLVFTFLIPLAVLILGIVIFVRRRNL